MTSQNGNDEWVVCQLWHHEAGLNVDGYGDAVPVPAFRPRMVRPVSSAAHDLPRPATAGLGPTLADDPASHG